MPLANLAPWLVFDNQQKQQQQQQNQAGPSSNNNKLDRVEQQQIIVVDDDEEEDETVSELLHNKLQIQQTKITQTSETGITSNTSSANATNAMVVAPSPSSSSSPPIPPGGSNSSSNFSPPAMLNSGSENSIMTPDSRDTTMLLRNEVSSYMILDETSPPLSSSLSFSLTNDDKIKSSSVDQQPAYEVASGIRLKNDNDDKTAIDNNGGGDDYGKKVENNVIKLPMIDNRVDDRDQSKPNPSTTIRSSLVPTTSNTYLGKKLTKLKQVFVAPKRCNFFSHNHNHKQSSTTINNLNEINHCLNENHQQLKQHHQNHPLCDSDGMLINDDLLNGLDFDKQTSTEESDHATSSEDLLIHQNTGNDKKHIQNNQENLNGSKTKVVNSSSVNKCDDSNNFQEIDLASSDISGSLKHAECSHFAPIKILGNGSFANVFLVKKLVGPDAGTLYAMKILRKAKLRINDRLRSKKERDILVDVQHPFIVRLNYAFQTEGKLFLVLDFVRGGDLFTRLNHEVMFTEEDVKFYLAESLLALTHLHSLGIIYRDFKPENILLDQDGHIKLTDFGLSKEALDTTAYSFCGTIEYMSPEVVERRGHTKTADFWSLGVVMYEMLTGSLPFYGKNKRETMLQISKIKLRMPPSLTSEAQSLLKCLLKRNPINRLGSSSRGGEDIMNHRFFSSIDFAKLYQKQVTPPFIPAVPRDSAYMIDGIKCPQQSPGVPASANAIDLFRGFSYVAPSLAKQCDELAQKQLAKTSTKANNIIDVNMEIIDNNNNNLIDIPDIPQNNSHNNNNGASLLTQAGTAAVQDHTFKQPYTNKRSSPDPSSHSSLLSRNVVLREYEFKEKIGHGSFSVCHKVIRRCDGKVYACKIIDKYKRDCSEEVEILLRFSNHPNIVTLHQVIDTKDQTFVIMEYLGGGELLDMISTRKCFTEREASAVMQVIAMTVKHLHDNGVVHRDLKPSNIMYGDDHEPTSIRICDFGFAKQTRAENGLLMTPCYTASWVAPEVLMEQGYDKACDVWSLGVLLFTLLAGYTPFATGNETSAHKILQRIGSGVVDMSSGNWRNISNQAKDLVQKMLHPDPKRRIAISDVLAHIWITDRQKLPHTRLKHTEVAMIKDSFNMIFKSMNIHSEFKLKTIDMSNIARRRLKRNRERLAENPGTVNS